jgi:two-component system, NtrC family, sensor kinase
MGCSGPIKNEELVAADLTRAVAELQRQLAECRAELQVRTAERDEALSRETEALAQQTATNEVLGVINSSPGDLAPVFDAMLEKALRLCEADIGTLWTYDGELMRAAAIRDASPELSEFISRGPRRPALSQHRILNGEPFVHIVDMPTTEAYRAGDQLTRAVAD